ncbi:methyl-accepting chemotaxis protein [Azospirillum thermophilum]|uniref:Methyl-accepting transducer domain-containing protein n=1 Tax=Azospirillum thermophilum TaxID=2202148 RepID=A0A2S2CLP4_9PROT|nr:methyl-accepting chemotaxis protein [Azospirillum thermophilum]AWK85401.1 hypothetical protein DEW08_03720 [Azospirillum thermophilum]
MVAVQDYDPLPFENTKTVADGSRPHKERERSLATVLPPQGDGAAEALRERKRLLLKSVGATTVPTIGAVVLVLGAFWGRVAPAAILGWAAVTLAVALFRFAVIRRARGRAGEADVLETAHRRTMIGTGLAGLMWIVGVPLFAGGGSDGMVLAFLYLILCCAGTISLSVYRPAFLLFVPGIMGTLIVTFTVRAATDPADLASSSAVAVALTLMTVVLFRLARQTDEQLGQSLALNHQNAGLVADLTASQSRTEEETRRQIRRREELERLALEFERDVSGIMADADGAGSDLIERAERARRATSDTLADAGAVASGVAAVAERIAELTAMAARLSQSMTTVSGEVAGAADIAREAVDGLDRTNETMGAMTEASHRIGEIVSLIAVIARQTNLLALNATIEATRAGEAGKGFAVVAAEVKNLADQTERASREVTAHLGHIQAITAEAAQAINGIGTTVYRINEIAENVVRSVHGQEGLTASIGRDLQRIAGEAAEVGGTVSRLDRAVTEATRAADAMTGSAGTLAAMAGETMTRIRSFLVGVKRLQ